MNQLECMHAANIAETSNRSIIAQEDVGKEMQKAFEMPLGNFMHLDGKI